MATARVGTADRVQIAAAAQSDDPRAAVGVRTKLAPQVADVHVEAAVVEGELASQGVLGKGLLVDGLARLREQRFEDAAFGERQADVMTADAGYAACRAVAEIAELDLAGRRGRLAAAQHGTQACGEFARVAGLGQVIVCAKFEAENPIQWLAATRQHQHRQIGMFTAQLLEQLQATAVGQHHVQDHRGWLVLRQRLACTVAIVTGMGDETFLSEPADQQLAEFFVIVDKQQFTHVGSDTQLSHWRRRRPRVTSRPRVKLTTPTAPPTANHCCCSFNIAGSTFACSVCNCSRKRRFSSRRRSNRASVVSALGPAGSGSATASSSSYSAGSPGSVTGTAGSVIASSAYSAGVSRVRANSRASDR